MCEYVTGFRLPSAKLQREIIAKRMEHNGGAYGYIDNPYPCGLFDSRDLWELSLKTVTILYGGNGSGKSTLLNVMASCMELNRVSPFNSGEVFDDYARACSYIMGYDEEGFIYRIPNKSRIITSDDIFDYMLTIRTNNEDIAENIEEGRKAWTEFRYADTVKVGNVLENYEEFRIQMLARNKSVSRRQFIRKVVGEETKLSSNGETAIMYFREKLKNETLYCLDEPENSMSPAMQTELLSVLEEKAYRCGCQFIIATHSPFLLSMSGARIYDLDASPVTIRNWWQLENTRIYYEFFRKHSRLFEDNSELIMS